MSHIARRNVMLVSKAQNDVLSVLSVMLTQAVEWRVIDHALCLVRLVQGSQGTTTGHRTRKWRLAKARPERDFR